MLTQWTLENFKPIRERLDLPLAPLTVLAGLNSSGKSSFLQSILLISQTMANQKLDEPLVLNGPLVRLGTFQDVCNDRAGEQQIRIGFGLDVRAEDASAAHSNGGSPSRTDAPRSLSVHLDVLFEGMRHGDDEKLGLQAARAALIRVEMIVDPPAEDQLRTVARRMTTSEEAEFLAGVASKTLNRVPYPHGQNYMAEQVIGDQSAIWRFASSPAMVQFAHMVPYRYVQRLRSTASEGVSSSDSAEEAYDIVSISASASPIASLPDQAAQSIVTTFSSTIRYLGPLRADPYAIQSYSPSGQPDDVGPKGEYAAAVFGANRKQPIRWWNPISQAIETATLEEAMDAWLRYLGVADHVGTREAAAPGVSWMVRSTLQTRERPLQAVGVGVSQVLPILVAGLLAPEGTILVMEQPELHLHERPQARLGDFFYGLTCVGKQVFVETHSAVLINQLRYLMVKGGQEARDAISIYFVEQNEDGDARFEPIHISAGGTVENWPDGFFDEGFRQEDKITQEGIRARSKRSSA